MDIYAIVVCIVALAAVASIAVVAASGHGDRDAEDAAREHFTRTGRWPGEE
ncbi:MAG: hypothetical protein M3469_03845 [Actinomycetota bacterium]|jgi:hypothetical protein|nr:hypothetical protein [Actinomycetota bacterium]